MRRFLLSLTAAMAAVLPSIADAHVEIHLGAGAFGELVRRRVEAARPCPQQLDGCLGSGVGTCYLDHVETLPGGFLRRVDGPPVSVPVGDDQPLTMPRLQYLQPIRVYSKTLACIEDPTCPDDGYEAETDLQLMLDIETDGDKLCLRFAGVTLPLPPGSSVFAPLPLAMPSGPDVCLPVRLPPVERLTGSGRPAGVLLAASEDLQTLALRLRFPLSGAPQYVQMIKSAWQSFLQGSLGPGTVPENGWSVFMSDSTISGAVEDRFQATLEKSNQMELDGDVDGTWTPSAGPAGGVGIEFYADVPVSFFCSVGLSPVNVDHSFSLDTGMEELVVSGSVSWSVNEADVLLCAMAVGHFDGLAVTTAVVGGGIYSGTIQPEPEDLPMPGECQATGDTTFTCRYSLDMPKLDGAPLLLSGASASGDGLLISGTVFFGLGGGVPPEPPPLVEVYDVTRPGGAGEVTACGGLYTHDPYWAKLRPRGELCSANILPGSDPLGVYGLDPTWVTVEVPPDYYHEFVVGVMMPTAQSLGCAVWDLSDPMHPACDKTWLDLFWEAPYDFKATVWTRDGARTVAQAAPAPPEEPTELDWGEIMDKVAAFIDCLKPFLPFDRPSWDFDPPPQYALHLPERHAAGTVTLQNVRFLPLSPMADARGQVYERNVWLGLLADATVTTGRRSDTVPVAVPFAVEWDVQLDVRGQVGALVLGRDIGVRVEVDSALPPALQGAWFDLNLAAGSLQVHGTAR
jgi:hypothetical protein